jgi:hypothetical protein
VDRSSRRRADMSTTFTIFIHSSFTFLLPLVLVGLDGRWQDIQTRGRSLTGIITTWEIKDVQQIGRRSERTDGLKVQ